MVEPVTLTLVGATVLTEGVKFLYQQAGKVVERWQARKKARGDAEAANGTEAVDVLASRALAGQLGPEVVIYYEHLAGIEKEFQAAWRALSAYAHGDADPTENENSLREIAALRSMLELVLQQRITFQGEKREPSGPAVYGMAHVGDVDSSTVVGAEVDTVPDGGVHGEAKAQNVTRSRIVGAKVGKS